MAKPDMYANPLIPLVLVAGILSGSLWRSNASPETGRTGEAGSSSTSGTSDRAHAPAPWISELRPALESLDDALGGHEGGVGEPPLTRFATVPLAGAANTPNEQVLPAMAALRAGLDRLSTGADAATCDGSNLDPHARVLAAWMLADDFDNSTLRAAEAKALLDQYRDWRFFADLAQRVKSPPADGAPVYSVRFLVATLPDYVDSNSGWLADQGLAAVQSGMAQQGYLFDRVRLIDWSRSPGGPATVASASRLHERQPGVIVFRRVGRQQRLVDDEDTVIGRNIDLEVVLTVLETPTAGVHQVALRNSLWFLRAWNACSGAVEAPLRILGPSFSGSTLSLAMVLGEAPFATSFARRVVVTGSATADENVETMARFSPGAIFRATVQPTSVLRTMMAAYLRSINSGWKGGRVALLNESNTAYGRSLNRPPSIELEPATGDAPFAGAKIFNFPLHIAQLRSDAPSLERPGAALISGPVIPLNMGEAAPPSDVIPALRPQLTSPIVESTVNSILDAIRHEKVSAVGIFATDDRDVLFLAREVKRAVPDVQLFLFGAHALYLHPDYLPYVRGALVASSYALTLANQPEIPHTGNGHRQPFQSMVSEGVFFATRVLVSVQNDDSRRDPLPYCRASVAPPCVPVAPASINVVGEDGYWTLAGARNAVEQTVLAAAADDDSIGVVPPPGPLSVAPLPPMPLQFALVAVLVIAIVAVHVWAMLSINRRRQAFDEPRADPSLLEWPLVRVLVPPRTFDHAAGRHRFATTVCFALLSLPAAWVVAIGLPFVLPEASAGVALPAAVGTCIAVVYAGVKWYGPRRRLPDALIPVPRGGCVPNGATAPTRSRLTMTEWTVWLLFGGMVVTMGLFLLLVGETAAMVDDPRRLALARIVGGGIVSPAAMTLFLATAFYTAVFTGVRRLSLVGFGYGHLARGSAAFRLLTAEREPQTGEPGQGSLAGMLDMPTENMPSVYPAVLLLILLVAAVSTAGVTTIEGRTLSWFVKAGTWTTLGLGLLQLAQGLALWHTARSHLKRLAQTPIEKHLQEIAPAVPWDISLVPPRLTELMPVAHMADDVIRDFRRLILPGRYGAAESRMPREFDRLPGVEDGEEARIGVRPGDLASLDPLFSVPVHVDALETEMTVREHAAIIQSDSWLGLWRLSDSLVTMLQRTAWQRSTTPAPAVAARRSLAPSGLTDAGLEDIELPHPERSVLESATAWFARCERLVALQMAFVLRDIVARTITCLFAAMLCLVSLTAAHLLYVFSGRASLLTIDMLAIGATALAAVWILVDMERDQVLSRLRTTTPGRVDINWEFIKRIGVYGVLPLLAVIAALFPEVGGTLFGWLEPLRKLSSL